MNRKKVLITTVPFCAKSRRPLELLENAGIEYVVNPYNKKVTEEQLAGLVPDFDGIIAGTEFITDEVMGLAPRLQFISRVGIGLDGVDLLAAKRRGIRVSYTPEAPAPAVAELSLGLMLTLLRSIHVSNVQMRQGQWQRIFGRRLGEVTVGIIGVGRIGKLVLRELSGFWPQRVLVNDIAPNHDLDFGYKMEWVDKEQIYREADVISLHLPLTHITKDMIRREQLLSMKPDAIIINTARGGIVNEQDLHDVMMEGHLSGAAVDVFEREPYSGNLTEIERCVLTAHMGSMSVDCRTRMELEATEEAVRFFTGQTLVSEVPQAEYDVQLQRL